MDLSDTDIHLNSLHVLEVDNRLNWSTIKLHILTWLTFGVVYKGAHWAWLALQTCKKLLRENQYDCVMTKSFPSELVGYWIKKHRGIKWIATWNDPYPVEKYPAPYGNGPDAKVFWGAKRLIPIMEQYPDMHLFPSDRLKNYMSRYLNIPAEKTRIIPHVVLECATPTEHVSHAGLSILHSGNLNFPRDPQPFLKAFSLFMKQNPQADVKVYFQGVLPAHFSALIHELGLENNVTILPSVPYRESMLMLNRYDVALIIEAPCDEGIFLPTKVSDYMQEGKVIFAVSPLNGVLHDLYANGNIGYFANGLNEEEILCVIKNIYEDFCSYKFKKAKVPAKYMPKYLVEVFSAII